VEVRESQPTRDGHNLELKAQYGDLDNVRDRIRQLGAELQGTERQVDQYFNVAAGRMKLRRSSRDGAHLIVYMRPGQGRYRESRFHRLPVADPDGLTETLEAMFGVTTRVVKTREVWWWRDVRVHLDRVEGMGTYVEFEARVDRIGDPAEAERRMELLSSALGIGDGDVLGQSYGEMPCHSEM
jgi:predicted adenylyl cyclase CyaB